MVVPKYGKTAVARNRLRRRIREIVRRRVLGGVGPVDLVVKARTEAYASGFDDLAADLVSWARSHSA
jgi:ribonuclease P protein component